MFANVSLRALNLTRRFMPLLAVLVLVPFTAEAKTLYVNAGTGNDATTYAANSEAFPWRTIGRAAWGSTNRGAPSASEAARAGDVVYIVPATYTTVGNLTGGGFGRQDVAYNPVNSGTPGSPIRFECTGTCVLTYSSGAGPMIGSMDRNYIEWSGFSLTEATAPTRQDTGPVTFFRAIGGSLENSILTGVDNWTARVGDNYTGVRLEDSSGVRIANNHIRNFGGVTGDRNHAGIETYRSYPILIENNEITNCGSGIYLKGTSPTSTVATVTVRFNLLRRNRWALHVLQLPMTSAQPALFYQNVFEGNYESALWINAFDNSQYDAKWVRFFNNTIVNNAAGMASYNWGAFPADANFLWANNIVSGTGNRLRMDNANDTQNLTATTHALDRNVYATESFTTGGTSRSLAYLRGFGQDSNSVVTNPGFVSATDYRLASGSPARTVGRALYGVGGPNGAVIPAGAYITGNERIGPSGAAAPGLPSAPTGLRIGVGGQ